MGRFDDLFQLVQQEQPQIEQPQPVAGKFDDLLPKIQSDEFQFSKDPEYNKQANFFLKYLRESPDEAKQGVALTLFADPFHATSWISKKFGKGEYSAWQDAVSQHTSELKWSDPEKWKRFLVSAEKLALEFGATPSVAALSKIPKAGKALEAGARFAAHKFMQAPSTQESEMATPEFVKERAKGVGESAAFGTVIGGAGEAIKNPLIRILTVPTAAAGFTTAMGGTPKEIFDAGVEMFGWEIIGLAQKGNLKGAITKAKENPKLKDVPVEQVKEALDFVVNPPKAEPATKTTDVAPEVPPISEAAKDSGLPPIALTTPEIVTEAPQAGQTPAFPAQTAPEAKIEAPAQAKEQAPVTKAPSKTAQAITKITTPLKEKPEPLLPRKEFAGGLKLEKDFNAVSQEFSKPIRKEIQGLIDTYKTNKNPEAIKRARETFDFYKESYGLALPTGERLKGGKKAGGITVLSDLSEVAVDVVKRTGGKVSGGASMVAGLGRFVKRNLQRTSNYARTLGEGGKVIGDGIERISSRISEKIQRDDDDLYAVYRGLNKHQRELIGLYRNNRVDRTKQPAWVKERADKLLEILDRALNEKMALGGEREKGGQKFPLAGTPEGLAYPHVLNNKGMKDIKAAKARGQGSPRVYKWAQRLVDSGKAGSVDEALANISKFVQQYTSVSNPYLMRSRENVLFNDQIEWDGRKTLPRVIKNNWIDVESAKEWGIELERLNASYAKIGAKYGLEAERRIRDSVDSNIAHIPVGSTTLEKWVRLLKGFQFTSKVGTNTLAAIQNQTDRFPKGLVLGNITDNIKAGILYPPYINKFLPWSRRIERNFVRQGIIQMQMSAMEGYEVTNPLASLTSQLYQSTEIGNQTYFALVKKIALERDIQLLQRKSPDNPLTKALDKIRIAVGTSSEQVENRFSKLGNEQLVDELRKSKTIDPELLRTVLHRTVQDTAFPLNMATQPIWWNKYPWLQVPYQFKHWQLENLAWMWRDVLKDSVKTGNVTKLGRFMVSQAIVGEIYQYLKDELMDTEKSAVKTWQSGGDVADIEKALANDFIQGSLGLIVSMTYGLLNWTAGVSWKTGKNIKDALSDIYQHPELAKEAILKFTQKEVPVIKQAEKLYLKITDTQSEGIDKDYFKYRQKGFKWKNQQEHPGVMGIIKTWAEDAWTGQPEFRRGPNALPLEMVSRNIILNDIDDAARYMKLIMKDSPDTAKQIILGSMRQRSPLGPITDEERWKFISSLPNKEQQTRAMELWNYWQTKYREALYKAYSMKDSDVEEDIYE